MESGAATLEPSVQQEEPRGDPRSASSNPENETSENWTPFLAALLMTASLVMVLWNLQLSSLTNANTGSRFATIESLVDRGTYSIDKSRYVRTIDKVKARGHFVSSKPPLLPTYGAGVYWVYQKITGSTIGDSEGPVVWLVSLFTGWLGHLVFLIYFYRICRLLLKRQLAIMGALMAASFAYLGVGYATHINNHSTAAAIATVGLFYALRAKRDPTRSPKNFIFAGFWLGVLPAIDLSSLAITGSLGLYLLAFDYRRTLLFFAPALLPGLASQVTLSYIATGSFIPAYADPSLKDFPENYFRHRRAGIDALQEPKYIYAFHVLFGHHGLFSMTPLFLFSLYEIGRRLIRRGPLFAEALVTTAAWLAVLYFYIGKTRNYGGWCVGMRWLVPEMPLLLVFFGIWLDRVKIDWMKRAAVVVAFAVGAFHVQDALSSPFQFSVWHNFIDGTPNRGRIGHKWNLAKKKPAKSKAKTRTKR